MTRINNYDQSSTGINISCQLFFDTWQARNDFNDNFIKLEEFKTEYNSKHCWLYTACNNVGDTISNMEYIIKGKKQNAIAFLKDYAYFTIDFENESAARLKEYAYETLCDIECVNYSMLDNLNNLLSKYSLELKEKHESDIIVIETRGYSQGDYAEVYCDMKEIETLYGKRPSESELQKEIDNLFWNCPVSAKIEINGEEYFYESDPYSWSDEIRREFIETVAKDSGVPFDQIDSIMPIEPSY